MLLDAFLLSSNPRELESHKLSHFAKMSSAATVMKLLFALLAVGAVFTATASAEEVGTCFGDEKSSRKLIPCG
jgi:hypothetical protein